MQRNPCRGRAGVPWRVYGGGNGSNLSIIRNYAQGDDFILGKSTTSPGQPTSVSLTTAATGNGSTSCSGNVATTTLTVETGVTAERGILALQGKPWVLDADGSPRRVRAKTPTREWIIGTGALPAEQRRDVVDTGLCLKCHVGSLYQHGGNRVDNVSMCILCHNPASSEQNNRVSWGVTKAEAYGRQGRPDVRDEDHAALDPLGRRNHGPVRCLSQQRHLCLGRERGPAAELAGYR